jgi:penicillin-binding protein 2
MSQQVYAQLNAKQANDPFLNRAIDGRYPVGSTFKPFVAATALDAGLITPSSTFFCPGTFTVLGQTWKDWNPSPLGNVSVVQAIEQSVDVFFYNLGYQLYQQTGPVLQNGVQQFGFGKQTGVDLPGENAGRVPDKVWKASVGKTPAAKAWTPGDDVNLAIGQGDLLATPLQVAVGFSAIANGGDVWIPHLGLDLTDASGNVVHTFDDQRASHIDMTTANLDAIRSGLRLVISDPTGTAYHVFQGFPVAVAGKTGTAQMPPGDAEAWFAGYAPADNPQIVVVALVEHGGHGSSVAAPIVRSVMEAFFHTKSAGVSTAKATE